MATLSQQVLFAAGFSAALLIGSQASADSIKVQTRMDGAASSVVPSAVRSQCRGFGTTLPSELAKRNDDIILVESLKGQGGKRLALKISYMKAKGGGAWSGAKKLEVTGKLMRGSKVLGSFTAYRGSYKGKACKSLYRVEQELAKDIALWLENPGMHDKLGAAK